MRELIAVLLVCLFLLSCADGGNVSVVRQSGMFDFPTDTAAVTGSVPASRGMPLETEGPAVTETASPETLPVLSADYGDAAKALLENPEFLALADSYGGRDDPAAALAALLAVLGENAETEGLPSRSLPEDTDTVVYYTPGGSVWHVRRDCPALSSSKEILSGSVDDAVKAGKSRECRRCGDS